MASRRLTLDAEVDLARAMLVRATELYAVVLEDKSPDVVEKHRRSVEVHIRDAINLVKDVVATYARIRENDGNMVSAETTAWMTTKFVETIDTVIRPVSDVLADSVFAALEKIRLPSGSLRVTRPKADEQFL